MSNIYSQHPIVGKIHNYLASLKNDRIEFLYKGKDLQDFIETEH